MARMYYFTRLCFINICLHIYCLSPSPRLCSNCLLSSPTTQFPASIRTTLRDTFFRSATILPRLTELLTSPTTIKSIFNARAQLTALAARAQLRLGVAAACAAQRKQAEEAAAAAAKAATVAVGGHSNNHGVDGVSRPTPLSAASLDGGEGDSGLNLDSAAVDGEREGGKAKAGQPEFECSCVLEDPQLMQWLHGCVLPLHRLGAKEVLKAALPSYR
eukprot:scaffold34280_cov18-Tisochrysis_lutea.AAC.2